MDKMKLSFPQKNIWLVEKFNEGTNINSIVGTIEIKYGFDTKKCNEAINEVIKNNDALRLKFVEEFGNVFQILEDYEPYDAEFVDFSDSNDLDIASKKREIALIPLDIFNNETYKFYILKYTKDSGAILMKIHHLVCDAWSCSNIGTDIASFLENGECEKRVSYKEFLNSEDEYVNSEKYLKDKEFWNEYLDGIEETVSLKETKENIKNEAKRYSIKLSKEENDAINSFCKENRVSVFSLFLGALSTYIYRIKDKNDFVIGTPILNRSNFKEKQILGMFISTIPLRIKIEENQKFIDVVKNISSNTMNVFRHQKYPYSKILEDVRKNTNLKDNLYNVILSYQNARAKLIDNDKYSTSWIFNEVLNDQLQIHVTDMDNTGNLLINYDYLKDAFENDEVEYIHTRLMAIIKNAIKDIDIDVENIDIISDEEKNKIIYEFNNTTTNYPKDKTVIELFEEQVTKTPDNVALVFEDKAITYKELNEKANRFAHYLKEEKGLKENDVVGIMIDKSIDMICTIISCLKLRVAYIPIEINYPKDRVKTILEDCEAKFLILNDNLDNLEYDMIKFLDESKISNYSNENVSDIASNVNDTIYIMYTSGTTGKPKGVAINNINIVSLVKNTNYIDFMKSDRLSQTGSIMFDASTFEYWGALLNGLTLYLIKKEVMLNPIELSKYIRNNDITVMFITSALFNQLVEYDASMFKNVRVLLTGGEILSVKHMNKVLKNCPNTKLYNVYGPTETTTFATFYKINDIFDKNIPIGKPLANKMCYIIDNKNRLLPIYAEGELAIGGDGVAKGYIKREDLNSTKFIFNQFSKNGKIYKTGDVSYFDNLGNVNFVCRIDNQIKINGFRIELDEIKTKIINNDKIQDCYVFIKENDGEKSIGVAYTVNDNEKISEDELKKYLTKDFPYYMVPKYFIEFNKLPLNKNGKVDGKKVKEVLDKKSENIKEQVSKENYSGIYLDLYNLFSEVLNKKNISMDDNFFEIGGDSIIAIKLITIAISKNIAITYADFFKNPTIRMLGNMLLEKSKYVSISEGIEKLDYSNINKVLKKNKYNGEKLISKDLGNVLLIGVTGFLGAHILDEFMKNEKGKIYCVIRKKENLDIETRIKDRLNFFFGNKYDSEFGKRIFIIEGDLENKDIITDKNLLIKLKEEISTVINAAANVRHFGNEEKFRKINVTGVGNLVDFCIENNKKLIHTSTLSVSGNILETGQVFQDDIPKGTIYNENNLYIGQNLDNIYAYTKFLGEKVVLDAICNKGLDAKIMRMGNLTGREFDGKFQPNVSENAFANRLKTFIELGVLPENILDFYLEFTPIDYAAKSVILLSKLCNDYNVFHLFNHKHIQMEEVDRIFNSMGINLKHITKKEMTELIDKYSNDKRYRGKIQGIILDINKNKEVEYKSNIKVLSDFTIEVLKKLGFDWPEVKDEYIKKYINYLYDIKFLSREG